MTMNNNQLQEHLKTLGELLNEFKTQKLKDIDQKINAFEKFKDFDQKFNTYQEPLTKIEYLKNITETDVFTAYSKVILHDTEKCFPDEMTQQNREMFYRLKFRANN